MRRTAQYSLIKMSEEKSARKKQHNAFLCSIKRDKEGCLL